MKSKLRSRWSRPNEKSLENGSTSKKNNEPFGEIKNTGGELIDDLSNSIPIANTKGEKKDSRRENNNFNSNQFKKRPKRSRKPRISNSHSSTKETEKTNSSSTEKKATHSQSNENKDQIESTNRKPRRRRKKNHSSGKKTKTDNNETLSNSDMKAKNKTGISGFIAKIFGG